MLSNTIEKPSYKSYFIGFYLLLISLFGSQRESLVFYSPYIFIGLYFLFTFFSKNLGNRDTPIGLKFYFCFGLWAGISHFWAPLDIKFGGFLFLVITISIVLWSSKFAFTKADLLNILSIYAISIIPIVFLNLGDIQKSLGLTSSRGGGRFYGTFGNANLVGMYGVSIVWSISLILFNSNFSKLRKLLLAGLLPFAFQLILISGSRKAFIGFFILVLFLYWFLVRNVTKNIFIKIVPAVIFGTGLYYLFGLVSKSVFFFRLEKLISGDSATYKGRSDLMEEAFKIWQANPIIGVGFDSFRYYSRDRMPSHSSITETLASTGTIGFLLYFTSLFLIMRLFYKFNIRAKTLQFKEYRKDAEFFMVYILIFLFFNSSAILYNSRDMWPILGILYIYSFQKYREMA